MDTGRRLRRRVNASALFYTIVFVVAILVVVGAIYVKYIRGNKTFLDTTQNFNYGIIRLADDRIVQGEVQSWNDYEGDQIQVTIGNETYLVHASNVTLISK